MIDTPSEPSLIGMFLSCIFFFLGFIVTTYFARIKGFLSLPFKSYTGIFCSGKDIIIILLFFVLSYTVFGSLIYMILAKYDLSSMTLLTLIPVISFLLNIALITIYAKINNKLYLLTLIKDPEFPGIQGIGSDILSGIKALILSLFPLFALMSLIEGITMWMEKETTPAQTAVKFLMQVKETPSSLFLALFTIIIAAPIIEEYLFRGVIQSYLRNKYGSISAIVSASALFSLFHFSPSQGFQNIGILLSLFILSLYLGFVYEKTRSLISNITLHVTFNLINAIKIIFYTA